MTIQINHQNQLYFESIDLECSCFGGGYSADNIVVHFPDEEILFANATLLSHTIDIATN